MLAKRSGAASVILNSEKLWVVGGYDGNGELNSSEIIQLNKNPIPGPSIPFSVRYDFNLNFNNKIICSPHFVVL